MERIPNWLLQTFAALLAILVLVLILSQAYSFGKNFKNIDTTHTITISAQGKITVSPDLATINATITTDAATADSARTQNDKKMNTVVDYVKGQSIDAKDITTSNYSVYPKYDYSNGNNNIIGYTASQTLTIKVRDLSKTGNVMDGLTKNGINQIQGIDYSFADPDSYKEQAREQALSSAKDKASKLANAAGVKLGKLVSFSENSAAQPIIYPGLATGMGGASDAKVIPQLQPGTQDITADVSVTYEIK